jgi:hypothetical protein
VPSLSDLVAGNVPTGVYHAFDGKGKEYTFTAPLGLSDNQIKAEAIRNGLSPSPNMGVVRNYQQTPGVTDTVTSNLLNLPSFNGASDVLAAGRTGTNYLLRGLGLDSSNASLGDTYTAFAQDERADEARGNDAHPIAAWSGYLGGIPYALKEIPEGVVNWLGQGSGLARFGKNILASIPVGAVSGALSEDPGHMTEGAVRGGATAAVVSPLIHGLVAPVAKVAGWAWDRLGPQGNWAAELANRLEGVISPDEMQANADRLSAAGVQPAPLDVVGPAGQDVIRGIAERPGANAQPVLEAEATARAQAAPGNMADQVRNAVLPSRLPGIVNGDIGKQPLPLTLRENLGDLRDQQFGAAVDPIRGTTVELPPDVTEMLSAPDMRSVVSGALKFTRDPVERKQLMSFARSVRGEPDTVTVGGKQMTADEVRTQFGDQADRILRSAPIPPLSLGAADALRRALGAAEGDSTPAFTAARQELSRYLESAVPEYGQALQTYRTQSGIASPGRVGDVSKIGKDRGEAISLGEQLLTGDPEQMALTAKGLPPMDEPVSFGTPLDNMTITPRQAAVEGAARAVERQTGDGNALKVANGIATTEQQARNRAILTPSQANNLEKGIQAVGETVTNVARATPGRYRDDASERAGDAILHAAGAMSHSPVLKARGIGIFLSRLGVSKQMAANIAKGAIDPAQTQQFIDAVAKRGVRREKAIQMIAGIRNLEARGLGIAAGYYGSEARQNLEGNAKPAPIQANSNNGDMYLPQAQEPADQQQSDGSQDDPWQWDGSGQ